MVVILSNGRDECGQFASYDVVDDVRQMLFKALLGWNPAITEGGVVAATTKPAGANETRPRNVAFNYIVRAA